MSEQVAEREDLEPKESQAHPGPEVGCPMASMCSGIFEKAPSRFLLMVPGMVLILVGAAILIQPQILIWLVAGAAVLLGVAMLWMANLAYRFGAKAKAAGG